MDIKRLMQDAGTTTRKREDLALRSTVTREAMGPLSLINRRTTFRYIKAEDTDIRKTFERVRNACR